MAGSRMESRPFIIITLVLSTWWTQARTERVNEVSAPQWLTRQRYRLEASARCAKDPLRIHDRLAGYFVRQPLGGAYSDAPWILQGTAAKLRIYTVVILVDYVSCGRSRGGMQYWSVRIYQPSPQNSRE